MVSDISYCDKFHFSRLVKQKLKKRKRGKKAVDLKPRWEDDYELVENEGLFAEYLEMGLCGFFCLAPLC